MRSYLDNSATLFEAYTYVSGDDGGFNLDFKTNNHLKGKLIDKFSTKS